MHDEHGIKGDILKEIMDLMDMQMLKRIKKPDASPAVMSVEVEAKDAGSDFSEMAEEQLDPGIEEELAKMYEELE